MDELTGRERVWEYFEPCCGAGSIICALMGAKSAIVPYQGSKWRLREPILKLFDELGFRPQHLGAVRVYDVGPWVIALPVIFSRQVEKVDPILSMLSRCEPRSVYDAINGHTVPVDDALFTAQFLFLQRVSFSGKAVGIKDGKWSSPGFNKTSAYGKEGTDVFGSVRPQVPQLSKKLKHYRESMNNLPMLCYGVQPSSFGTMEGGLRVRRLVYIDPPYRIGTGYPDGTMSREEVVRLALHHHKDFSQVVVSEGEPIRELVELGWLTRKIQGAKGDDSSPFKGKQEEWLTYNERRTTDG